MQIQDQLDTLSRHEKAEFLRTNATNIKEGSYFKKFNEDELNERKDTLVDTCIQIDAQEIEKSETVKMLSDALKIRKAVRTDLTKCIKQKGEDASGEIFEFAEHETGYMVSFDIEGNEINRRRLRPEEKQTQLFIHQSAKQA